MSRTRESDAVVDTGHIVSTWEQPGGAGAPEHQGDRLGSRTSAAGNGEGTLRNASAGRLKRFEAVPNQRRVSGDAGRLQQVLWNLLANAITFTPEGGRVGVFIESSNDHMEIRVVDTGQGIRPDFLPHALERFRQTEDATTQRHTGLGRGLGIVRQLVELHGGTVHAASEGVGRGATFTVRLPIPGR